MLKDSLASEAADIIGRWPDFAKTFAEPEAFYSRILLPIRCGRLKVIEDQGYRILYSWMRPEHIPLRQPRIEHWSWDGPDLWLADICFDVGAKTRDAVQAVRDDMLDNGIAEENERIFFWRDRGKYGHGTVSRSQPSARERIRVSYHQPTVSGD